MIDSDPTKLLGQPIGSAVDLHMRKTDLDEFEVAEKKAIFDIVHDRINALILEEHPMWDHILLCVLPFAAAAHNLDDLDNMIEDVVDWLDPFDDDETLLSVARTAAKFADLSQEEKLALPSVEALAHLINMSFAQIETSIGGIKIQLQVCGDDMNKFYVDPAYGDDAEDCIFHNIVDEDDGDDDDRNDPPDDNSPIIPAPELITV